MKVRATATGYAGKDGHALREPGDVFEIEDDLAKEALQRAGGTWFAPVDADDDDDDKPRTARSTRGHAPAARGGADLA